MPIALYSASLFRLTEGRAYSAQEYRGWLEDAGLVVSRRAGRSKLHFLNPLPIRLIHDRWIDKYTERQVSALAKLKSDLEEQA